MPGSDRTYRFTAVLERSANKLWGAHVRVPQHVAEKLLDSNRRVICVLNGTSEFQCAMLPQRGGSFVISVNKPLREKLGVTFGMEIGVSLRMDRSAYGLPVPEELEELFRQDRQGSRLFHTLTRGRQRTLLYMVGSVKSPDKRTARAVTILAHLKMNKGRINYRQLYTAMRAGVQR